MDNGDCDSFDPARFSLSPEEAKQFLSQFGRATASRQASLFLKSCEAFPDSALKGPHMAKAMTAFSDLQSKGGYTDEQLAAWSSEDEPNRTSVGKLKANSKTLRQYTAHIAGRQGQGTAGINYMALTLDDATQAAFAPWSIPDPSEQDWVDAALDVNDQWYDRINGGFTQFALDRLHEDSDKKTRSGPVSYMVPFPPRFGETQPSEASKEQKAAIINMVSALTLDERDCPTERSTDAYGTRHGPIATWRQACHALIGGAHEVLDDLASAAAWLEKAQALRSALPTSQAPGQATIVIPVLESAPEAQVSDAWLRGEGSRSE